MMKKWNKTALIVVPLLVVGTVATFAAENAQSPNKQATASAPASTKAGQSDTVTSQVVASQTLTPQEMQQLQQAKPAAATTATTASTTSASTDTIGANNQDQSLLDANNPFLVQGGTNGSTGTDANGNGASTGANTAGNNDFSLDLVKNLDITMNTTQGMLTLHFRTDGGQIKLDGDLGGRHITLAGDQAEQILNGLLQSANLSDALTASLNGQQVNLDSSLLGALQTLHVELKDGRKIDTNPHGNAQPGNNPKAAGRHDNGKHKGQEKGKGHGDD